MHRKEIKLAKSETKTIPLSQAYNLSNIKISVETGESFLGSDVWLNIGSKGNKEYGKFLQLDSSIKTVDTSTLDGTDHIIQELTFTAKKKDVLFYVTISEHYV